MAPAPRPPRPKRLFFLFFNLLLQNLPGLLRLSFFCLAFDETTWTVAATETPHPVIMTGVEWAFLDVTGLQAPGGLGTVGSDVLGTLRTVMSLVFCFEMPLDWAGVGVQRRGGDRRL
jgi:hypothetical protein